MGTILPPPPSGDFATPQIVQYTAGQKFDLHHDWYERPQMLNDGTRRMFNRPASFFVILRANCSEGETWFQGVEAPEVAAEGTGGEGEGRQKAKWREYEKGGTAFRPIPGNALFWVNLLPDGRGDKRTMHAGLPVGEGMKTAMNIWPRRFYED
jgi:prolyl 4-hydroxylase